QAQESVQSPTDGEPNHRHSLLPRSPRGTLEKGQRTRRCTNLVAWLQPSRIDRKPRHEDCLAEIFRDHRRAIHGAIRGRLVVLRDVCVTFMLPCGAAWCVTMREAGSEFQPIYMRLL